MSISFSPDSPLGRQLTDWWKKLKDDNVSRAELKRCDSVEKVMMTPVYQRLCYQLQPCFKDGEYWQVPLAMVIGLASHLDVKDAKKRQNILKKTLDRRKYLAEQIAGKEKPIISELRFRRLLQKKRSELYHPMIRVIRMLKGDANLYSLAESVFYWGDEIKKDWAFAYFAKPKL